MCRNEHPALPAVLIWLCVKIVGYSKLFKAIRSSNGPCPIDRPKLDYHRILVG